jgi:hypothetical protein
MNMWSRCIPLIAGGLLLAGCSDNVTPPEVASSTLSQDLDIMLPDLTQANAAPSPVRSGSAQPGSYISGTAPSGLAPEWYQPIGINHHYLDILLSGMEAEAIAEFNYSGSHGRVTVAMSGTSSGPSGETSLSAPPQYAMDGDVFPHLISGATLVVATSLTMPKQCGISLTATATYDTWNEILSGTGMASWGQEGFSGYRTAVTPRCSTSGGGGGSPDKRELAPSGPDMLDCYYDYVYDPDRNHMEISNVVCFPAWE